MPRFWDTKSPSGGLFNHAVSCFWQFECAYYCNCWKSFGHNSRSCLTSRTEHSCLQVWCFCSTLMYVSMQLSIWALKVKILRFVSLLSLEFPVWNPIKRSCSSINFFWSDDYYVLSNLAIYVPEKQYVLIFHLAKNLANGSKINDLHE